MTLDHTRPTTFADYVASQIRAEMGRLRLDVPSLTEALAAGLPKPLKAGAVRARFRGEHPFSLNEVQVIAPWLGVPLSTLLGGYDVATEVAS